MAADPTQTAPRVPPRLPAARVPLDPGALAELAGATIEAGQAMALAARLAHGLGIAVRGPAGAFPAGDDRQ